MTATLVLAILGTGGISAVFASIVTGVVNRRKLGAEATEIITKAASGVVELVTKKNVELTARVEELETRNDAHRDALQLHAAWDAMASVALREHGITNLPAPPPLYPPRIRL